MMPLSESKDIKILVVGAVDESQTEARQMLEMSNLIKRCGSCEEIIIVGRKRNFETLEQTAYLCEKILRDNPSFSHSQESEGDD